MKKGFTLVELLAIIAIIGLVSVITVPIISNTIDDSKKNIYNSSIQTLEREAEQFYMSKKGDLTSFSGCEYNFSTDNNTCVGFTFKGKKPESGTLKIASNGFTTYALKYDKYCYTNYGQNNPIITQYSEENCKIKEPSSFATDSLETIIIAAKSNNISMYNVGDTKEIELKGFGEHTIRIANMSNPTECNTPGFSQTACGFVLEFTDIITNYEMNPYTAESTVLGNGNIGGWEQTEMRLYIKSIIYNALPETLKNSIKETYIVSGYGSIGTSKDTQDKLYLLSTKEVNYNLTNDKEKDRTRTLDYYIESTNSTRIKKNSENVDSVWWLRTAYYTTVDQFYRISATGENVRNYSNVRGGISPAFRL